MIHRLIRKATEQLRVLKPSGGARSRPAGKRRGGSRLISGPRPAGVILLLLTGCTLRTVPIVPPEDVGGTCETARANIEELGGCGQDMVTFADDCEEKVELYASVGDRFPVGCLTVSKSCPEAEACR